MPNPSTLNLFTLNIKKYVQIKSKNRVAEPVEE